MKFDKLTYTVSEMMGPPQKLTITPDGKALYESHSNISMSDTPEIGFYQMKLPAAEIEKLNRSLDNPPFQSLPDHWGRIAAGDRYQRIALSAGSSTIEKRTGTTEPVDPGMAKLLGRFDQVVAEVMQHPKRTLRMKVSRLELDESGTATLDFELVGGGAEAVDIVNPATLAQGPGLSLQGWPDKPPDEFQAGEVFGFSIDEITELKKPEGALPETLIQITPGEVRSFHAGVGLPVPAPQTYLIQLVYQNANEFPENPAVMIGELFSKRIKIDVPAPKK